MNTVPYRSHRTIERSKDRLVNDLRGVVADADDLLKVVGDATTEELAAARSMVEAKLGEARSRVLEARTAIARQAHDVADATQEYLTENRLKVLGVAALAGLITAVLLSRR
jgi:ElaB/YqjD/DUF883 family membrane-anchored ribosome-binding protein